MRVVNNYIKVSIAFQLLGLFVFNDADTVERNRAVEHAQALVSAGPGRRIAIWRDIDGHLLPVIGQQLGGVA